MQRDLDLLEELLREEGVEETVAPRIRRRHAGEAPASLQQRRLWFLARLDPDSAAYNIATALRLTGVLDVPALERAVALLIRRHEILRTTFCERDGYPWQIVSPAAPVQLPCEDWRDRRMEAGDLDALVRSESHHRFDLERGPLLRIRLTRLADTAQGLPIHILFISMHHIIADGWSLGVLIGEIVASYRSFRHGQIPSLEELPVQYADYAAWQHEQLDEGALAAQLRYWQRQLHNLPIVDLPTDRPRPRMQTFAGDLVPFGVPADVARRLRQLARGGTTLFMVLAAAFGLLLARHARQREVVLGTSIAQRDDRQTHGLIGFFINMLVLRFELAGEESFSRLLDRVRAVVVDAFDHADLPYETLVERLQLERDPTRNPLFQIALTLLNAPESQLDINALSVETIAQQSAARFDLEVFFHEQEGGAFDGVLSFNTDLFLRPTIERLARELCTLLEDIAADPGRPISDLRLISAAEEQALVAAGHRQTVAVRDCIHQRFARQVGATPELIALELGGEPQGPASSVTYAELEAWTNATAHRLVAAGVGAEVRVGLWLERSIELVVAILATLKAGGTYVPLDPAYPQDRVTYMVEDSGLGVIVTSRALAGRIPVPDPLVITIDDVPRPAPDEHVSPPCPSVHPDNAAYVIYTSGSTGKPKGVVVTHANVMRLMDATDSWFHFGRKDVWTLFHSYAFDFSVWEIWGALLHGGKLIVVPYEVTRSPDEFYDLLCDRGVTILNQTPSAFRQLIDAEARLAREGELNLRTVIFGGETLDLSMLEPWLDRHGDEFPHLVNMYGITETTVHVTYRRIRLADVARRRGSVIGVAIPDLGVYLLDERRRPVPPGALGEVAVGGAGVARGYLHRPALTAERMVPDPFDPAGGRLYMTGDVARRLPDGDLEYRGRADDQVKVRGFRIELAEIEAVIMEHPAVQQAVVTVHEDDSGDRRLVAYVVPRADAHADLDQNEHTALGRHAAAKLPDYMVPSAFVLMSVLPLTPSGKLDRKALLPPDASRRQTARELAAPRTETERLLCSLFAEVLGLDQISVDGSFFALGGHSLLATRLIGRIRAALGVDIPVRTLFETPTVEGLAARLGPEVSRASTLSTGQTRQMPAEAQALDGRAGGTIPRATRHGPVPLLPAQTRLWFLDLMDPGNARYNVISSLRLLARPGGADRAGTGLDTDSLRRALDEIVRRHEILRTVFRAVGDEPRQVVEPPRPFALQVIDCQDTARDEQAERLASLAHDAAHYRFDLAAGPLMLGWLVRLSDDEHRLLIVMHHIVTDGWSFGVLTRELHELYAAFRAGRPSPLHELPIQYADFACWQRARLAGGEFARQREYWLKQLAGLEPVEILPLDRARKPQPGEHGETLRFVIEPSLERGLTATATRHGATLFMALLTALAAVLHRSSGATDLPIGTPVAVRDHAEVEGLVGFFVNTLVLRIDADRDPTLAALLMRVRETALSAYSHQDLPFEEIVEKVAPPRHRGRHPLFGVMIVLQNAPGEPLSLPGLSIEPEEIDTGVSKFDLTLLAEPSTRGLECVIEYDRDLLERHTVEQLASRFTRACTSLVEEPDARLSALSLESETELERRRERQHGPPLAVSPTSVTEEIFRLATLQPDAVALCGDDGTLSYGELARRVERTAAGLQAAAVPVGGRVGAAFERSCEMIVAALGIMHAGAAYVPLDPAYPAERLAFTIEDSGACLILAAAADTLRGVAAHMAWCPPVRTLADLTPGPARACPPSCDRLAYVIYTSGSTGVPKGVMVSQSNLWASTAARVAVYDEPRPRFPLLSSFAFDSSVAGIFGTLCAGGTLLLPSPGAERDPARLPALFQALRATQLLTLPALYQILLETASAGELDSLQTVIVAGEDCSPHLLERHRRILRRARLANEYGPTEASVWSTVKLWPASDSAAPTDPDVTIGTPIPGAHVWICEAAGGPAPLGAAGEILFGGPGVALGYAGRPGRTAESFVPDPVSGVAGARCYRTGDRARFTPCGELRLLGRIDRQIKVRGFRVEPGEVEARIQLCAWVREVAVTTTRDARDRLQFVAHVVPAPQWNGSDSDLRSWLAERVPAHMVPAIFVRHDKLPRAPGGKVDYAALDAASRLPRQGVAAAPRDRLELQLVRVWEDVLGAERIGIDDDFFELGGHSLLAVELMTETRRRLGRDVPLATLFSTGTVARLAEAIRTAQPEAPDNRPAESKPNGADVLVPLSSRGESRPLYLVHQAGGNVLSYLRLARSLGAAGLPLVGVQARGLGGSEEPLASIDAMAAHYVEAIRGAQPVGPYRIGGHSLGGRVAHEMARQLESADQKVEFLAVIDVPGTDANMSWAKRLDEIDTLVHLVGQIEEFHGRTLGLSADDLRAASPEARAELVVARMKASELLPISASAAEVSGLFAAYKANLRAIADFTPQVCGADLHVFATRSLAASHPQDSTLAWGALTRGVVRVVPVPGEHMSLLGGEHVAELARLMVQACDEATRQAHSASITS
jgi:amino acid adenylation domain-containing protein